ncbi:MAG: hypothetical protein H7Z12_19945 [Rhodospirillaceae bacterium]|nr:hypothetical protein [Rhodospirillales bacterium]
MSRRKPIVLGGSLKLSAPAIFAQIPELAELNADMEKRGLKLSREIITGEITRSLMVRFSFAWKSGRVVYRRQSFEVALWAFSGRPAAKAEG